MNNITDSGGKQINYKAYLSRNLSGRRQKILNPAIVSEADVQILSSTHTGLVDDTNKPDKTFGTSEWRATNIDYDHALKGEMDKVDTTAAYACEVQIMATHKVAQTARHGDVKGLETTELFTKRIADARGDANYKATLADKSLTSMDDKTKGNMQRIILEAYNKKTRSSHADWAALTAAGKDKDALNGLDLTKLEVKGSGDEAAAQRNFIDRYLTQFELDDKLNLSSSPGSVLTPDTR